MPRLIRANPGRDENAAASASDCIAHRCLEHAELKPVDDHADDGSECAICVAHKFADALEASLVEDILKKLFWPMVQSARDRLNLVAAGAGDTFEAEARELSAVYENPDG
jgi:hypothetical protein